MTLLSLPDLTPPEIYAIGDVTIHERAAIAPGVILQAAPGCQIVIDDGACIGMGCIVSASHGSISIGKGAILGAGVLMAGSGTVGKHACVGAASTLWHATVEPMTVVPPGALVGDASRQVTVEKVITAEPAVAATSVAPPDVDVPAVESDPWQDVSPSDSAAPNSKSPVVGQIYINQLLYTLFPGRELPPDRPRQFS